MIIEKKGISSVFAENKKGEPPDEIFSNKFPNVKLDLKKLSSFLY